MNPFAQEVALQCQYFKSLQIVKQFFLQMIKLVRVKTQCSQLEQAVEDVIRRNAKLVIHEV